MQQERARIYYLPEANEIMLDYRYPDFSLIETKEVKFYLGTPLAYSLDRQNIEFIYLGELWTTGWGQLIIKELSAYMNYVLL